MATLRVTLSEEKWIQLKEKADRYHVTPEELFRVTLEELLTLPDEAFRQAVDYVLTKNAELYRRLAKA
ncbi:MAG: DNA-binding protein [Calditrichaeota bacterium]|nr:DNA-binding protein [Calditrichota bacterium]